ncbi:restriction endonuclease subunit S [Xanthomonas arboricola]|uniref:restriction endonuclease subunit S n=1 Tax=Xanthomonas arboricola TaxID=56448 RepID=UPI0015E2929C
MSAKNISDGKIRFDELRLLSKEDFELEDRRTNISPDDVLLTIVGALGRSAVVPSESPEFTVQRSVAVLKTKHLEPNYLRFLLESPIAQRFFQDNAKGTAQKGIYLKALGLMPIVVAPLAEQKRIAQKLDALLAQVDTLKARIDAIPALLKRFRQSVLTSAATCELTSEWRATQGLDDPVPTKLGELIRTGPQNGLYKPSSTYGSGTKIVRIDGFYSGELRDWHSLRSLQLDAREEQVWALNVGDILINRVNSIEYLGKCALVRSLPGPTVFESNMMRIAVDERVIEPEFLMRALSAEIGRARLIANAKHAVNQASINQGDVKACSILVPTLSEQTEIVRRVEQLFAYADQLEAKVAAAQQRIDALTQSLLAKAFRGELVPQDPTDEPASVLLERIRTQRAATPKPKRGRKAATS